MDSGHSSSMQSSSGGDEEHDSRATVESVSALFNNPSSYGGRMANQPPPQQQPTTMFDPLSNYFDPLTTRSMSFGNQNSVVNLDMGWSDTLRSEPNCNHLGGLMGSSLSTQSFFSSPGQRRGTSAATFPSSFQIPTAPESSSRDQSNYSKDNNSNNISVVKNTKKRSRASRRAPTTVLTTDTTNFRAMVQEFTGIPAQPFTSSPFPRTRFDLFGTSATTSLRSSSSHMNPLRPLAQKVQPLQHPLPPSFDATGLTANTSIPTSISYNLPSDLTFLKEQQHPRNLLTMQNPVVNFQSLLQASPKYMQPDSSINVPSKPQQPSNIQPLKMGVLEEFGPGHGSLANIVSNSAPTLLRNNDNLSNWVDGVGSNSQRSTNGEKGSDNVPTRNEGMVESWICSSD